RRDSWRARLAVPDLEWRQVDLAAVLERLDEILAGRRLAVMPVEIEVRAFPELVRPEHRRQHADDFGALVVDRRSVEVRNLNVGVGPHWVGEGPLVLRELNGAQHSNILDALDRRASDVRREALIAKDGEAFLEAQLEPVAAGHPVARPVVETFVRDHPRGIVEVAVGRDLLVGEYIGRVEDVEAL